MLFNYMLIVVELFHGDSDCETNKWKLFKSLFSWKDFLL